MGRTLGSDHYLVCNILSFMLKIDISNRISTDAPVTPKIACLFDYSIRGVTFVKIVF